MDDDDFNYYWRALEDAGQRFGSNRPSVATPILPHFLLNAQNVRSLIIALSMAALGPPLGFGVGFAYLDSAMDLKINPAVIIAGFLIISGATIYILKWAIDKWFSIIDGYPKLVSDVKEIAGDVTDIKTLLVRRDKTDDETRTRRERADDEITKRLDDIEYIVKISFEKRLWELERKG